jgi:thiosulfate/3-mercaptopyruvate sulfurtransferase
MKFKTLISLDGLVQYLGHPDWVVVDCRFWLDDTEKGRQDYVKSHIPGAIYAHLDEDLSGEIVPGKTGRHPLPGVNDLTARLGSWGIGEDTQVVAYDDRGGMIAGRLWWLLRWLGHETVAVLNGGFPAWVAESHPISTQLPRLNPKIFIPKIQSSMLATADDVLRNFGDPRHLLVDSRAPERYRGENEPIDPVAGRIPGAINYFWGNNLDSNGFFEIKDVLRGRFGVIFNDIPPENITFYCGSGVTGAHNVLAVAHSGMGIPKLYADSWSHWITDPDRPLLTENRD